MKRFQFLIVLLLTFGFISLNAGEIKEKLGIGFIVNSQRLFGDTRNGNFTYGVNPMVLRYNIKPFAYLESDIGFTQLTTQIEGFDRRTEIFNLGVKAGYRFLHTQKINPLLYLGLGMFNSQVDKWSRTWGGYGAVGVGTELFLNNFIGINLNADYRYTTGDNFDGGNISSRKDGFINIGLGLNYYLGKRTKYMPNQEFTNSTPESDLFVEQVPAENKTTGNNNHKANSTSGQELQPKTPKASPVKKADNVETAALTDPGDIKTPPAKRKQTYYTVQSGDYLSKISLEYYGLATRFDEIIAANPDAIKDPDIIHSGQKLMIPFIKKEILYYTVRPNDWLSKIALKYYGDINRHMYLLKANQEAIKEPNLIYAGQSLRIPPLTE